MGKISLRLPFANATPPNPPFSRGEPWRYKSRGTLHAVNRAYLSGVGLNISICYNVV